MRLHSSCLLEHADAWAKLRIRACAQIRIQVACVAGQRQTRPFRTASTAAWPRVSTSSLPRMLATCLDAVRGLMKSASAISLSE